MIWNPALLVFAQEKRIEAYYPSQSREECLKNFDITKIDYNDPKVKSNIIYLKEYFQCLATVEDNGSRCNPLFAHPQCGETCRNYFGLYQKCLGKLLAKGYLSPDTSFACRGIFDFDKDTTKLVFQGWLKNDISVCEKTEIKESNRYNLCKALISGDDKLCRGPGCEMIVLYSKAIKSGNIGLCENIENHLVRIMCRAYISGDEKICRNLPGVLKFRDLYCGKESK